MNGRGRVSVDLNASMSGRVAVPHVDIRPHLLYYKTPLEFPSTD